MEPSLPPHLYELQSPAQSPSTSFQADAQPAPKRLKLSMGADHSIGAQSPARSSPGLQSAPHTPAKGFIDSARITDPTEIHNQAMQIIQALEAEHVDGRQIAADFLEVPSRDFVPMYYQVITKPIAINDIKRKLQVGQYANLAAVRADIEQMWKNAFKFNNPESPIYVDGRRLQRIYKQRWSEVTGEEVAGERGGRGGDPRNTAMRDWLRDRLTLLQNKADPETGRKYSQFFLVPPPEDTPRYYDIIKKPMSFTTIQVKLAKNGYSTAQNFMNDVQTMFSNAKLYNQAGSLVWNDADALEGHFQDIMANIPPEYQVARKKYIAPMPSPTPTPAPEVSTPKLGLKFKLGGGAVSLVKHESADQLGDISNLDPVPPPEPEPPVKRAPPFGSSTAVIRAYLEENDLIIAPSDPPPAVLVPDRQHTLVRSSAHGDAPSISEFIVQSGTSVEQEHRFSTSQLRQFCIMLKRGVDIIYVYPSLQEELITDDTAVSYGFECVCRPREMPASRMAVSIDEAEEIGARTRYKYALRPPTGSSSIDLLILPPGATEKELYRLLVYRGPA